MGDFNAYQTPKAKKAHDCRWCQELVAIGETYHRISGRWEGEFFSDAWHMECLAVMNLPEYREQHKFCCSPDDVCDLADPLYYKQPRGDFLRTEPSTMDFDDLHARAE